VRSRREFIQNAAAGALLVGAEGVPALAAKAERNADAGKSRVVIARDPEVLDASHQPIPERVKALLDRAMTAYTGKKNSVDAWKQILGTANVVGLKTNGLGGKGICTHAALVYAVAEELQRAGIAAGNIIVWDRNGRDLEVCGLKISTDMKGVRCFGSDVSGFDDQPQTWGTARIRLSKILTEQCDLVIGLPILKDHIMSGVTFAMKNMYGVVDRPQDLHAHGCCPGVADLNCIPVVRKKVRFTVGDALTSVYNGGPAFHPERLWYPNALVVGEDRVALDQVAWQMIEKQRAAAGMPTLEASGRPPRYIAVAADAEHGLGTNDPARMHVMEI
jgi:uncharacterized protein (DUF362 family)